MRTCHNCACDPVCDHNWNGWETCGNWIQKPGDPPINADRIRAMSDEEIAELLITADFCEGCEYCDKVGICRYFEAHPDGVLADGCRQAARKWLQQPAEENT